MNLSYQDIAEILKSIDESDAEQIEIEVEGFRLAVRKRTEGTQAPQGDRITADPLALPEKAEPEVAPPAPEPASQVSASHEPAQVEAPADHSIIRAPMVGTFYRRPDPESEPFVKQGSTVRAGDPLCLIEVMKLYTTIESTVDGTVVSIFAEEGSLVEFNQQLFLLSP
ncbi:MAG: acetyl-CoA carboxylase biotin carboxyl carrier protein [Acidiferrobacterales bacterium]|nr:acetyl-CoA carboxylase biotin carboxyl carrier protein [Acidiferrobacterales bacterium]